MMQPDKGEIARAIKQLVGEGADIGHVEKMRELYPYSVVAMASLRSCAAVEADEQLPSGWLDVPTTEAEIMAAFDAIYVADVLHALELDRTYGERIGPTAALLLDLKDHGVVQEISPPSGLTIDSDEVPKERPKTATMAILVTFSKKRCFTELFRSRMTAPVGSNGERVVDEAKKRAVAIAVELTTKKKAGATA